MAIEYKKPTTFAEGGLLLWTDEPNCYDQSGTGGDETTFGYQDIGTDEYPSIRFYTWETKEQTYTATTLKLKWKTSIQTGDDEFGIEYTKDGGSQWNDLVTKGVNRSSSYTTAEIALDANQDLTQVEIRVNSDKIKGGDGCDLQISDIWTEGTTSGGVSVPINQIVSKVAMFAVTVLTGVVVPINQTTANITPYSVEIKVGQTVSINSQIAEIVPHSITVKTGAKVPINVLTTKITPYSVTVGGGISVPINLLTLETNTIAPTVSGGAKAQIGQSVIKTTPYPVTINGGAKVLVNQIINKIAPYPVTVGVGGTVVPINLITHRVTPYPVVVTSGVKVDINQLINKIIPYPVTIAVPIKSVKGIMSETLRINGFISMDKDYIAPKGIVSNSFIIKGIMQLQ